MNKIRNVIFLLLAIVLSLAETTYAEETNLAKDCLVRADKSNETYIPGYAVDGIRGGSYWQALCPCWIEVDMGEIKEINKVHLYMWWGDYRYYQYYIEISSDRKNWKEVVDERKNIQPPDSKGRIYPFTLTKARFVRLTVTDNSKYESGHVKEIEVYGK